MEDNRAKKLLDSFVDRLKANKRLEIAVYCGLGALCLLLCLPAYGGKKQKEEAKDTETVQQDDLEQRLMDTLSCVRGAGKGKSNDNLRDGQGEDSGDEYRYHPKQHL